MFKQVIVVRKDIKMDKGKTAAQVAHASLEAYKRADVKDVTEWETEGMKKIVVGVKGIKELMIVKNNAKNLNLPYYVVRDAGKTQLTPGTVTVLGIGPSPDEKIDRITRNLKLL